METVEECRRDSPPPISEAVHDLVEGVLTLDREHCRVLLQDVCSRLPTDLFAYLQELVGARSKQEEQQNETQRPVDPAASRRSARIAKQSELTPVHSLATLNPCQGENSALYTRPYKFGRRKKKKQNGGVAAAAPTDYSNISGDVSNAQSESNSHEPDQPQSKTSKTQSQLSLDKLMEAIKPINLRNNLLANIQAVFDDTMFDGAQYVRTEMDKSLAEICGRNENICTAITTGRGSLQIVVKEGLRGSLGHLTERLFSLGVADSRNVLMREFSEISKGQTHDDLTIWTNLQQEYCKQRGVKSNNATSANVAKWALEAKIAEISNESEVGKGSKGKFWEKANRLNEITVFFGRGVLFALDKEISGSVVEKLAMKEGVPGSLKSLDVSEHQGLKAFLNAIWTIMQGDVCLTQHSLQAVPKDGIEKVQQLLRHFPYSDFDTLSQYLKPECPTPIENQELEFDAILRGTTGARKHEILQLGQESSHSTHSSFEVPPLDALTLISSGGPEKRHDVACDDGIADEESPASQYDGVTRDPWLVRSPPTQLRGPLSSSDASLPTADDSDSTPANPTTSVNLRSSEMGRSTPVSLISTSHAKPQGSQQSDIQPQNQAEAVDQADFASEQALSALSQQYFVRDISSQVQKRPLPPLGGQEQSAKRQRTNNNHTTEKLSPTIQSASLPSSSPALTGSRHRPICWKIYCPICRCGGMEADEFKVHLKELHLFTYHGKRYDSALQTSLVARSAAVNIEVWCIPRLKWSRPIEVECPVCNFKSPTERETALMHPLEHILEPYDKGSEIYEHAEAIAVIWPDFAGHPVFDLIFLRLDQDSRLS